MAGLAPPGRTSFGTRMIRQAVEYDLHGRVERDYRPGGLHCVLTVPAGKIPAFSI
jgi:two-component sensor histidine kinase